GLAVLGPGFAIYLLYLGWTVENYPIYLSALAIQTVFVLATFYFANLYDFESISRPARQVKNILPICAATFLVLVAMVFALKISAQFSRVWFFSWLISATLLICVERTCFYIVLRKWAHAGRLTRNMVVVGAGEQAKKLLEHLDRVREPWIRIVGIFDDRVDRIGPTVAGQPVLGTLDDLLEFAREHRVDDIIITLPWSADERLFGIINRLMELPVHVRLGSDLVGFMYPRGASSFIGGVPMLDVVAQPLAGWKYVVKALEDRILAAILVILSAPLMVIISAAIKLESKGPVLFHQPRYGFNNKVFPVYKFRTMHHDRPPEDGVPQARRDDPRVTRVGAFLRRTSLDELPQLFNVLQGTMSLVGPRPHAVVHNEEYAAIIAGYFGRHRVKPGITGWAQVNGLRGETDTPEKMEARVEYDIYYIENWSLLFDLQILVMTVYVVCTLRNAY
ncbi:MAG: undecaprenyl-phosphate glucose phosphotransferase, partial [Proteobacteria bacterium]|nr:undecaprenyl-phosphate glucose phosphotransferase [Pseudomonadota bacterium]